MPRLGGRFVPTLIARAEIRCECGLLRGAVRTVPEFMMVADAAIGRPDPFEIVPCLN